ncbi:hypothetical protein BJ980_003591 [Nocardioides daedukensis]|uniref:GerMN domain-containing protein n=1 Tax=Nocardioides daedukensis TaxID=634462 RepID=A0A7Y9S601_9ACTN|nr:Gmad2 immunoglobulin-like domain-containing protein [Nocardioides daedukensis]NYG60668.1 hypothetical protein [Nocardioides daedukensis]
MSSHKTPDGGQGPLRHEQIRSLMADAVSDVEPDDRLDAIRNATKVTSLSSRRPWLYGVAGAVVATAATITAVAVLGNPAAKDASGPDPANSPTVQATDGSSTGPSPSTPSPSDPTPDGTDTGAPVTSAIPVYYVGDTARGPRLFREFHKINSTSATTKLRGSLQEAVAGQPMDPDYDQPWPSGTGVDEVEAGDISEEVITVRLRSGETSLSERPSGLDPEDAEMAVQSLVYTAQAAVGAGRHPVRVLIDGEPADMVLGVPAPGPLTNAPVLDTLSLMNITAPREGITVDDVFTATGVNNGFEAWVGWQVVDSDGKVVADGFGTADGWAQEKLFAWKVEVDVSSLAPGTYTFRAHNDDPTGGTEGSGPDEDTRTIKVE